MSRITSKQLGAADAKAIGTVEVCNEWHDVKVDIMKDLHVYQSCQQFKDAIGTSHKASIVGDIADEFWDKGRMLMVRICWVIFWSHWWEDIVQGESAPKVLIILGNYLINELIPEKNQRFPSIKNLSYNTSEAESN